MMRFCRVWNIGSTFIGMAKTSRVDCIIRNSIAGRRASIGILQSTRIKSCVANLSLSRIGKNLALRRRHGVNEAPCSLVDKRRSRVKCVAIACLCRRFSFFCLVCRFWPNGYYGKATKRARMRMAGGQVDSWCALGLVMPEGTKLKFRFHIGQELSAAECISRYSNSPKTCYLRRCTQHGCVCLIESTSWHCSLLPVQWSCTLEE